MKNLLFTLLGVAIGIGIAILLICPKEDDQTFVPGNNPITGDWLDQQDIDGLMTNYQDSIQKALGCVNLYPQPIQGGYIGLNNLQYILNNNGGKSTVQYRFFLNNENKIGVAFYVAGGQRSNQVLVTGSSAFCPNTCIYP